MENVLHLPRRSACKSMHGGQRILLLCAKPRIDYGDAAADRFAGGEIAFGTEKQNGFVAGRLIVSDVSALEINDRFRLRRFDDGALHAMLVELEMQHVGHAEPL